VGVFGGQRCSPIQVLLDSEEEVPTVHTGQEEIHRESLAAQQEGALGIEFTDQLVTNAFRVEVPTLAERGVYPDGGRIDGIGCKDGLVDQVIACFHIGEHVEPF